MSLMSRQPTCTLCGLKGHDGRAYHQKQFDDVISTIQSIHRLVNDCDENGEPTRQLNLVLVKKIDLAYHHGKFLGRAKAAIQQLVSDPARQ